MTMKTSCISRWSNRVQHFSNPAVTEPFAWLVSSETTVAIWSLLAPNMGLRHKGSPAWCHSLMPAMSRK